MECVEEQPPSTIDNMNHKTHINGIHREYASEISKGIIKDCNVASTVLKVNPTYNNEKKDYKCLKTLSTENVNSQSESTPSMNGEATKESHCDPDESKLCISNSLKTLNLSDSKLAKDPCMSVHEDNIAEHVVSASHGICYVRYKNELQMPAIMHLITKDLSEPYSIYTYRYFIHNWPHLCFLAIYESKYVGAIVCKLDLHKKVSRRGYIAMLAVDETVRRRKIGSNLVKMAIEAMTEGGCDEVVLETEVTNHSALKLYENLGFVRDKRLFRYYLNGVDALRLKLWLC